MSGLKRRLVVAMLAAGLIACAQNGPAQAQGADAVFGAWKLNLAKSKYNPGPAPQSMTIRWEPAGSGVKSTSEVVTADGKTLRVEYTASYDGKDYPMTGSPTTDTVSLRRIDANTVERTDKKSGKVTIVLTRTISGDGKTMTVVAKGTNAAGQPVDSVIVLEKQ